MIEGALVLPALRIVPLYPGSAGEIERPEGYGAGLNRWRGLPAIGITAFPVHMSSDVEEEPHRACS